MTPVEFVLSLGLISLAAGLLTSLVGLGGGIIVVPALTLLYGIDIRLAIGASIVSVIATSSGAAVAYVRDHMVNLRAGIFLGLATTVGAATGAYLSTLISGKILYILFAGVLLFSATAMFSKRHKEAAVLTASNDRIANFFNLHGSYYDKRKRKQIDYKVIASKAGVGIMYLAGIISALLGVGSGTFKVMAMDISMRIPIKPSVATSNFMIGVTAAASAGTYFARGQINPFVTAPVAIGILIGAIAGSHLLSRIPSKYLRILFVIVMVVVAIEMLLRGIS